MSKKLIIILIVILAGVTALYFFSDRIYPAAVIDWHFISLNSLNRESAIAGSYYQKFSEVYNNGVLPVADSVEFAKEMQRTALDKLIEEKIVDEELAKRLSSKDINDIMNKKIDEAVSGFAPDTADKIKTLYGLSMGDFREYILEPQAKTEILQGRFTLENNASSTFDEWLNSIKLQDKVVVLVPGLMWTDGAVVSK